MIPKSFSATSLQVANLCLARYKAEMIDYAADHKGTAAMVGTVLHGALERFVQAVAVDRTEQWTWQFIERLFHVVWDEVFGPDRTAYKAEYDDAFAILKGWFARPDQQDHVMGAGIITLETKRSFPMPTPVGEIPVNYIMDRLEQIGDTEFRVVDYKSNRVPLTAMQLYRKLQARLYALAVQIMYKDLATRIWVEFDYLRHGRVAVVFTREDNAETWRELRRSARRIVETDPDEDGRLPETLNEDCGYCVRKATCKTLQSNVQVGGIEALSEEQLVELFHTLDSMQRAHKGLLASVQDKLLHILIKSDVPSIEVGRSRFYLAAGGSQRVMDTQMVAKVIGPELMAEIGNITLGAVDELLRGKRLTDVQKALIASFIRHEPKDPKLKVERLR